VASELQRLVENLGRRLHRSVAIDDPEIRLLAYNPHVSDVDAARTESVLRRSVSPAVVDYVYDRGGSTAADLFTVPARPDLGLDVARIGMPVRHQGALLGFVWMLASDGPVGEEQATAVRRAADSAALILHRDYLLGDLDRRRERELAADLLDGDAGVRRRAGECLIAENLFSPGPVVALVVLLARPGSEPTDQDRLALAAGADHARRHRAERRVLTVTRPDHAVVLLSEPDGGGSRPLLDLADAVHERVAAEAGSGASCRVGVGGPRASADEVVASYVEARRAAEVAAATGVFGAVADHRDLGVYRLLAGLPPDRLTEGLPPGLQALLERRAPADDVLIRTVETFLDNAGDVKRTADQLRVHRTTLYYRLKRVEEATGLDLSVGDDRLVLHLGLRIAPLVAAR
jgi:hypothetical protein